MSEFVSRIKDNKYSIRFVDDSHLYLNKVAYRYSVKKISPTEFVLTLNNKTYLCSVTENQHSSFEIVVNSNSLKVTSLSLIADKAEELLKSQTRAHSAGMIVNAPMPGLILKIKKQNGDYVERGETVMILEAMKMENEIRAPISGNLVLNSVTEGKSVEKNVKLFEII
ncbi:biotin/lipoyl-containing protein [Ignavibacterium album]|uniref:biotin/lipoyl-containing protein n=1 Tax=Ignavibacterium album TaxID=591197 RepID=UPI0026F2BD9F|nr:acetyl-CoA carboxylase biotin carboxyl carrier protein subunit [Ignavibacterium album]